MTGLTYCDGYFPFQVMEKDFEGNEFTAWDGATYFTLEGYGDYPSRYSNRYVPVYGPATNKPAGFTLQQLQNFYWRGRKYSLTVNGIDSLEVKEPAITNGGASIGVNIVTPPKTDYIDWCEAGYKYKAGVGITEIPEKHLNLIKAGGVHDLGWKGLWDTGISLISDGPNLARSGYEDSPTFSASDEDGNSVESRVSVNFSLDIKWKTEPSKNWIFPEGINSVIKGDDGKYYPDMGIDVQVGADKFHRLYYSEGAPTIVSSSIHAASKPPYDPTDWIITENTMPFTISILDEEISFNVSIWAYEAENYDPDFFTTYPSVIITADKYWTYGGIYDEDTGARV